jgi:EAL domain-containing protein (putative c-di-GMP-specific phosphodiesterase class I)
VTQDTAAAADALRILIVDDDPTMVELLAHLIKRTGQPPARTAADGFQALAALDEAAVDLIFCDIDMPGMDGVEFLRHLRGRAESPPVVLLSSTPDVVRDAVEKLGQAHQLRILGSLPKPASLEAVERMIAGCRAVQVPFEGVPSDYFSLGTGEVLSLLPSGIEVHYQPIHRTGDGAVYAVEALARLRHPTQGLIGPALFVPICEKAGAASLLLHAVLASSLAALAQLRATGHPDLHLAVNLSSADLTSPDLVGQIGDAVERAGLPTECLVLELTESQALHDTTLPTEILTRLRVRRIGLAVDDFGTGYASLKQLRSIPFTELKIDRSFVRNAHNDARQRIMLASTIELARELSLMTVAEGVETPAELELLRGLGCDLVQGFHLSRPMPYDALQAFLATRPALT